MSERRAVRAFTLIELLVVMTIIMLLAGLLLGGITAAKKYIARARCQHEISQMMVGLTQYNNDFSAYPPGGTDGSDSGKMDQGSDDLGAGHITADPNNPLAVDLQLRTLTVQLKIEGGNRVVGPWYQPNRSNCWNTQTGAMIDIWGNPYRYLADGRRTTVNQANGLRMLGRVNSRMPVIWSLGQDGKQDPLNDNLDNNGDGKVDDPNELVDDICSWNIN